MNFNNIISNLRIDKTYKKEKIGKYGDKKIIIYLKGRIPLDKLK